MPSIQELQPLLSEPREDLSVEYKTWLDFTVTENKAILAKAAIALVNHGGGFIVIGFDEVDGNLVSNVRPSIVPEITQDAINGTIRRFATPEFHCEIYNVSHPVTGVVHPVVAVPSTLTEPVMSKRDCLGVIAQNRCYIRKSGPRSEEPQTGEEWRSLLRRCVLAGREDMLEAIRSIVSGRVEVQPLRPNSLTELSQYVNEARERWSEVVSEIPEELPPRFPYGFYEMGFSLVNAEATQSRAELQDRLAVARRIKLTGWTPFLEMGTPQWAPYPHDRFVEAWVGRPARDGWQERASSRCDFWRASPDGKLYTIRGYTEDGLDRIVPGTVMDVTLPVWRVGETILFASRFAETFEGVEEIVIFCRFTGLTGRRLTSISGERGLFGDDISGTNEITLTTQVTLQQIQDNLVEVMHTFLQPLYECFNFFRLPASLVDEELERMRGNRH